MKNKYLLLFDGENETVLRIGELKIVFNKESSVEQNNGFFYGKITKQFGYYKNKRWLFWIKW